MVKVQCNFSEHETSGRNVQFHAFLERRVERWEGARTLGRLEKMCSEIVDYESCDRKVQDDLKIMNDSQA